MMIELMLQVTFQLINILEKLTSCILNKSTAYNKIRFQGIIYSVGDTVMLCDGNDGGFYVAKIIKILPTGGISEYKNWPSMQVQWYYKPKDIILQSTCRNSRKKFSKHEVFESNYCENIIIESIISKCKVTTIEKYKKEAGDEPIYFTRASYNHKSVSEHL